MMDSYEDEEDAFERKRAEAKRYFKEFDCPSCSANNPVDPPFTNGTELLCNYCGIEWRALLTEEGKLRFKEI